MEQIYKLIQGLFEKHVGGTIAVTEFWPSLSCQLKKMDLVHALLSY
jgi:hypothetical protein